MSNRYSSSPTSSSKSQFSKINEEENEEDNDDSDLEQEIRRKRQKFQNELKEIRKIMVSSSDEKTNKFEEISYQSAKSNTLDLSQTQQKSFNDNNFSLGKQQQHESIESRIKKLEDELNSNFKNSVSSASSKKYQPQFPRKKIDFEQEEHKQSVVESKYKPDSDEKNSIPVKESESPQRLQRSVSPKNKFEIEARKLNEQMDQLKREVEEELKQEKENRLKIKKQMELSSQKKKQESSRSSSYQLKTPNKKTESTQTLKARDYNKTEDSLEPTKHQKEQSAQQSPQHSNQSKHSSPKNTSKSPPVLQVGPLNKLDIQLNILQ